MQDMLLVRHSRMHVACVAYVAVAILVPVVTSSCHMTDSVCEFWLEIELKMTMMAGHTAVYPYKGRLYRYDDPSPVPANAIDPDDTTAPVVTADGWEEQRLVIVANGTMPGPSIEVYEDQTVIVHVANLMPSQTLSIHWHGLHQRGTPWMDGVAFVTQCPIPPSASFTYRFKAHPVGTFWYHSHIGTQRSMGLYGAFIVRPKQVPPVQEHLMLLQDWNHNIDSDLMYAKMFYGNYEGRRRLNPTGSLEGGHFSMFLFQSGLINGRGRFYHANGSHNEAPLTRFSVTKGKQYRFRVIAAGSLYPFRVSIDGHPLTVVASDGFEMDHEVVESLIINPGERYDVIITANQKVDSYWVRAPTLEVNVNNHVAEAILDYVGSSGDDPVTSRRACTAASRCKVANCPFSYFPQNDYIDCMSASDFRSSVTPDTPGYQTPGGEEEEIVELFMNFAFPGTHKTPASVNGIAFRHPPVSALTQPNDITNQCDPDLCGSEKICYCPQAITLEHNKVYQITLLNLGVGKGWAHPVHMHGHAFHLLKTGYPPYNTTTGRLINNGKGSGYLDVLDNPDIDCQSTGRNFCNDAKWTDSSWHGNHVPGLELENPTLKDTVIVPTGGYVVIRLRADNPGLWFMHCHIELHNIDGMALMLNESFSRHPTPPCNFPKCGSFDADKATHNTQVTQQTRLSAGAIASIVLGGIVGVCIIAGVVIVIVVTKNGKGGKD